MWSFFRLFFLFFLLFLFVVSQSPPTGRRVLVLLSDESFKDTHSTFFDTLEAAGQTLTFKPASDPQVNLQIHGEYLYDSLILFTSSHEELGGAHIDAILQFIDDGYNVFIATNNQIPHSVREIAQECGVEFDTQDSFVIDHLNFDVSDYDGYHNLIVANRKLKANVMLNDLETPILYRGIGMTLKESNSLVFPILSGDASSFSGQLDEIVEKPPHASGETLVLVAGLQARNNARVVISGSLDIFSDNFFESPVQKYTSEGNSPRFEKSSNQKFGINLALWLLKERGVLEISNATHHKVSGSELPGYRINDELEFSATIREWNGTTWVPFLSNDIQLEFVRLDPYVRTCLKHDENGVYSSNFVIPDVYGVFTFRLIHNGMGYTFVDWRDTGIAVRPFRHDEYERFIVAAYPYYASAFSMMFGFAIFTVFFLYHQDESKKITTKA